ncbi:MAG: FAD binding domain-containing protein [Candidatus Marinimicrobia bacterium]|nr:FAD binding domain-containing protein [Candidatus Neomarinimicrobiota bacterium]
MTKFTWFYPKSLSEACSLLREKNLTPHGGGTELIKRTLSGTDGMMSLKYLDLNYIKRQEDLIEIGSMTTYADIVAGLKPEFPGHVLVRSLEHAANTPCRNRITLGGSIAFVPRWSDLIGPLLALDAHVCLKGVHDGEYPISQFLKHAALKERSLITAVKFKNTDHRSAHYREVKTHNDMPVFTVTVLLEIGKDRINKARIFLAGTAERISRLKEPEEYLEGKDRYGLDENEIRDLVNVEFKSSKLKDIEYLRQKAKTETGRMIVVAAENGV